MDGRRESDRGGGMDRGKDREGASGNGSSGTWLWCGRR